MSHITPAATRGTAEPGLPHGTTVAAGTLHAMAPITPARALRLLVTGLVCLTTASGALLGALLGGARIALVAAAAAGAATALVTFFFRRRALVHFAAARQQAGVRGYAEGIAHGVLLHIAVYEAAVFPRTGPTGVTPEERAARRTVAYRMAALDEVPRPVREAAADALGALDDADRTRAEDALAHLASTVRQEYVRP
ncbi:hypothetical protein ACWEO4_34940 [Streptomyces sp. NPDC004393]